MRKIITVVGARPQFIKVAPVSRILRKTYQEILVNTGQHYDFNMSGVFFDELQIPRPDYNLEVGSHSHGKQTGIMLGLIEEILLKEKPDGVIVYGDTNSTLAGALAASKLHIPIFHVEAGLRSYNKQMPEEINRIMTDHLSSLLFAPTERAVHNLALENIVDSVRLSGDVMYDAVRYNYMIARDRFEISKFGQSKGSYYLCTIHRAENTDQPARLKAIVDSLMSLNMSVILPLHPRTHKILKDLELLEKIIRHKKIQLIEPVSYLEMLMLEMESKGIITDSGGVQKEAYFAKVPCFTLREETEWVETVNTGWNTLVNPFDMDLSTTICQKKMSNYIDDLYGDGNASQKIVDGIKSFYI
ncbi:non-hydrolyzing UDP-N-acetylglucosamine 2-epimerase [Paenibacillus qinlingensis]|uniref:UDP-N-acetylglucosamine 2-epimerase (Non-hydrolyzing)/UDP-GlcNAc3NAcA epimerase n=1 Tax=Paenibacillus qinlingensis TaxID=1837343 RepID=A0ABU1P2A3_9BACL|nr:UDP-N-acetylglucosamine 2-epimerase (non-hydrolyzing) [Paenibacillus qinlingensis]MDR6553872.1 UDP-N-acetylglucosamine 2-epimerase (non-hydrolyzing)/UDP-GlcNAc3NAcA epimerase [Paenibacillus qinlingensis]